MKPTRSRAVGVGGKESRRATHRAASGHSKGGDPPF
jgi:hypothetical protein